jgi:hypothetical protein
MPISEPTMGRSGKYGKKFGLYATYPVTANIPDRNGIATLDKPAWFGIAGGMGRFGL